MSDAPGSGGYCPLRCMMSGRLTPAAATATSTSPGPGAGIGRVATRKTSGPPGLAISITVMVAGSVVMRGTVLAKGVAIAPLAPRRQTGNLDPGASLLGRRRPHAAAPARQD